MNDVFDNNIAVIEEINQALANGNTDVVLKYFSDDSRWQIVSISTISGRSNILKALCRESLESLPVVTVNNVVSDGNKVIVESSGISGRRSGNGYSASYRDVYTVEDGKITELTTYVLETD